ncbi:MAG: N-acetylneuraminate synthase family protein [Lentisphaeria bacterium]|nr:N-acetylneuraminate synthase family protein [Lentisphaeria bacterium]
MNLEGKLALCNLGGNRVLQDYGEPYIVAELNSSHRGDVALARNMIESAKKAGCSCVKFQSWSTESLYSKTYYRENPIAHRFIDKFALEEDQLKELANYCKECDIDFTSTPYSKKEVDFLVEKCDVPYIKIASMELNNYQFLDYIARKEVAIVLSTGMGTMDEIQKAVQTIVSAGNEDICLLHCVSMYPPKISTIRLNNIQGLRNEFSDFPIGFSDHSNGTEMCIAAVALGAAMIEKHFTLDKSIIGMDNQMATEPEEMAALVQNCHNVYNALGETERIVTIDEHEQRKKMRRSIVATKDLKSGMVLQEEDLDTTRPGTGIPPEEIKRLLGKKLKNDVEADTLIFHEDILDI